MSWSAWKGYISFGSVSVPIPLFTAAHQSHGSLNQIHAVCGTRIKQQLYCPTCEKVVERDEIAKGYPVDKYRFITITPDDLKALEPESSDNPSIVQFVKLADVDPLYYESSYHTAPEECGKQAYALLTRKETRRRSAFCRATAETNGQVINFMDALKERLKQKQVVSGAKKGSRPVTLPPRGPSVGRRLVRLC
jgi:DNA end-binding protein Ku